MTKLCYIIAGPNGAGKTTFAREFLPVEAKCLNFINADLIAVGLAPLQPEKAALKASKLMLKQIEECIENNQSFALEVTLSGKTLARKITYMKAKGYKIIIYFLKIGSVELAIERVKLRVSQGGHDIPIIDIKRRFERSWINFQNIYKPLADVWIVFDTSSTYPSLIEKSE